jgi:hypothetical protein
MNWSERILQPEGLTDTSPGQARCERRPGSNDYETMCPVRAAEATSIGIEIRMTEFVDSVARLYADGVAYRSPGSRVLRAHPGFDGKQRPEPQRGGITLRSTRRAAKQAKINLIIGTVLSGARSNPLGVPELIIHFSQGALARRATLGFDIQRRWRKRPSTRQILQPQNGSSFAPLGQERT